MQPSLLLAEGDAELRDLYSAFLRKHGYDVAVAENGLDCLQQLKQESPHVLVLDLELCWGGGDGVLDWLRETGLHAKVPVVLTTTSGATGGVGDIEPPIAELLSKPFTLAALLNSVRAAIAGMTSRESYGESQTMCPELYIG
jgi:DNA-binding response OmpR family regulator